MKAVLILKMRATTVNRIDMSYQIICPSHK